MNDFLAARFAVKIDNVELQLAKPPKVEEATESTKSKIYTP